MKQKEKSVFAWLREFAGSHKGLYTASVATAVLGVLCSIVPYIIVGDMLAKLLGGNKDWSFYLRDGFIMAAFWLGRVIFHGISTTCSHKATFHVLGNIRKQVCDKLSRVPLGYVKDTPSGTLKNVIVERIDSIETTLAHVLPEFTANLLAPLCVFIYLCLVDWRMALVSLITLPLGLLTYMGMMIGYEEKYRNTVVKTKRLNDTAVEYINGIEVIKAFGRAKNTQEKFIVATKEGAECFVEWMKSTNVFFSIAMVLTPCTALFVLPMGGLLVKNGSLSVPDYVLCLVLSIGLISPLITVMSYSDDIAKVSTIIGEVTGILSQEELKRPGTDRKKPENYSITLSDVTFGYHDKEVLHGIDMYIKEGTVNALVGPSGSGKSTIAKLIASLWDVDSGSICIGGVDIRDLSLEEYNRKVAYVSQDNYLFDDTIRENIRMGRLDATDEEVETVAKRSGCHEFIEELEKGYDTVAGGAGGHLSGGERQRIAIARAMLKDAPIVIFDEATAYTDPENEAVIQASVAKLVQGRTLIVIAHRLSTIADADQIFVVKDGEILERGTHQELLANQSLYQKMWEAHMSVKDTVKEGEVYA
ncbi:ABC transporter ATP-binding protein [Novisyntrophococcus fermenticellae]|uniref:ABC transporter ATP-binding protein n=1 Tax=Novisyntrophococcus fermenticellae TaxID=2068655 RepID=UPI001E309B89|nr:ABC transporter ATP-binding protein [Novisyntrophococcus fermenticellae]